MSSLDNGGAMAEFEMGDQIQTTGWGRTARWPKTIGTIVGRFEDGALVVVWHNGWIEDEMDPREIERVTP